MQHIHELHPHFQQNRVVETLQPLKKKRKPKNKHIKL
jgi:hypothetical protein